MPSSSTTLPIPLSPISHASSPISMHSPPQSITSISASSFIVHVVPKIGSCSQNGSDHTHGSISSTSENVFTLNTLQVVLKVPPLNLHQMQTRSKSGIIKKKALLSTLQHSGGIDLSLVKLVTYKFAIKVPVWLHAMKEEVEVLHNQGIWSLIPLPTNKNLVGCKWVFKIKKHSDGTIARHKARLVAKGLAKNQTLIMEKHSTLLSNLPL
ncbi:hypothetical protein ACFX2G_044301 [Malus domestica]